MSDLHRGDVVWVRFPEADAAQGNRLLSGWHMAAVVNVERDIALVVPISSLHRQDGMKKQLSDTDLILSKATHDFLRHDSFLKGHQLRAVSYSWMSIEHGRIQVAGRLHKDLDKPFARLLIKALHLESFVKELVNEARKSPLQSVRTPHDRTQSRNTLHR